METYRLSSKLNDEGNEYLIQTANDANQAVVLTNIYINGELSDTTHNPHPYEVRPEEVISLVKLTHSEKKEELENLLQALRRIQNDANPEAMYQLGMAFYHKRFYAEASSLFESAVALKSDYHQAINQLGLTELARGNTARAIESASTAVRMRPGFADYHQNLGETYLADNNCNQAVAEFEKALAINMYYSDAYLSMGMAYTLDTVLNPDRAQWTKQLTTIKDCLVKATLIYADYRCPEFDEGMRALDAHNVKRALGIFRSVVERKRERNRQEAASFYLKAALFPELVSDKVLAERIDYLEAEIQKNPNYVDLQAELSLCYLEQARLMWYKGVEQYRKTHRVSPSLQKVRFAMEEAESTYEDISITIRKITD